MRGLPIYDRVSGVGNRGAVNFLIRTEAHRRCFIYIVPAETAKEAEEKVKPELRPQESIRLVSPVAITIT